MPGDVFILHCIFTKPRNTIFCLMIDLWGYTTAIIYVFGYLQAWIGLIIACMALVSGSMCVQCMNYSSYKTVFLTARNEMCNRALTNISQLDGEFWTSGVEKNISHQKKMHWLNGGLQKRRLNRVEERGYGTSLLPVRQRARRRNSWVDSSNQRDNTQQWQITQTGQSVKQDLSVLLIHIWALTRKNSDSNLVVVVC